MNVRNDIAREAVHYDLWVQPGSASQPCCACGRASPFMLSALPQVIMEEIDDLSEFRASSEE